ncbi:MAG: hypothetical protein Kow0029_24970 [Candidatus Rifleibacteriota bacterium]
MGRICEKLVEELSSATDSLSSELQSHILTCPECQKAVAGVNALRAARKGLTAKEAASIASIAAAVKAEAATGASASSTGSSAATAGKLVAAIALAGIIGAGIFCFNGSEEAKIAGKPVIMKSVATVENPQEVYITTAESSGAGSTTLELDMDSGSKLVTEDQVIELPDSGDIRVKSPSVFNHSGERFTLLKGEARINALNRGAVLEVSTPLADIMISSASAVVFSNENEVKIVVESGELKARLNGSNEEVILKSGQELSISPEKDTINPIGTIMVSPDQEDIKSR